MEQCKLTSELRMSCDGLCGRAMRRKKGVEVRKTKGVVWRANDSYLGSFLMDCASLIGYLPFLFPAMPSLITKRIFSVYCRQNNQT